MDHLRLVFPPLPASALVGTVYLVLNAWLPRGTALALFAGMGYGYVFYDCLHYAIHHGGGGGHKVRSLPSALLADIRSRHFDHHFRDSSHGFGISSVFFDVLLRTGSK